MYKVSGDFSGYCKIQGDLLVLKKSSIFKNIIFHGIIFPISLATVDSGAGAFYLIAIAIAFASYKGPWIRIFSTVRKTPLRNFVSATLVNFAETKDNRALKGFIQARAATAIREKKSSMGGAYLWAWQSSMDDREKRVERRLVAQENGVGKFHIHGPDEKFLEKFLSGMIVNLKNENQIKKLTALAFDQRLEDELKRDLSKIQEKISELSREAG